MAASSDNQLEAMSHAIQKLEEEKETLIRELTISRAAANWMADKLREEGVEVHY